MIPFLLFSLVAGMVFFYWFSGQVGIVLYDEHTNIQCIVVFTGVESAKPYTLVRTSNLPI